METLAQRQLRKELRSLISQCNDIIVLALFHLINPSYKHNTNVLWSIYNARLARSPAALGLISVLGRLVDHHDDSKLSQVLLELVYIACTHELLFSRVDCDNMCLLPLLLFSDRTKIAYSLFFDAIHLGKYRRHTFDVLLFGFLRVFFSGLLNDVSRHGMICDDLFQRVLFVFLVAHSI